MGDKPFNIMASIKKVGKPGPGQQKGAIQIESDDLWFDPDDKALAAAIANVMVVQLRENLMQGRGPAGEPLKPLTRAAIRSREYEELQGARGGHAHERYVDNAFRHDVLNNYVRDYTAPRLGQFTPHDGGPRGVLSGMLAHSFAARPNRDGKGVTIFVVAKRGHARPPGESGKRRADTKSALENVYGNVPIWSPPASRTPTMRAAMTKAAKSLFGKKITGLGKALKNLASQAAGTAQLVQSEAEDAE